MVRNRAEKIAGVDLRKAAAATGSQQGVVIYRARFAGGPGDFFALRPLDFDRRQIRETRDPENRPFVQFRIGRRPLR